MEKNQRDVRVTRTSDKRSPRGIRRLGQALIALAQAQAEAEAQAQAEANADRRHHKGSTATGTAAENDASRSTKDEA